MASWSWHNGRSIRHWTRTFYNFKFVVKDYENLDLVTKTATMKASSSVVSIITRTGEDELFCGSGTIIEYDKEQGVATVLTSATLLRDPTGACSIASDLKIEIYLSGGKLYEGKMFLYDFCYNIATIKIKSATPLSTASIRNIDDSVTLDSRVPILVKHSNRFKLCPGDRVIALGRDYAAPHEIMASPGVFSVRDCRHDYKELFSTSCVVTQLAIGGPLINCNGEVIGINFFVCPYNVFTPINIVSKCLEDLKQNGHVARPWVGASIANLHFADLEKIDKLHLKFPNVSRGVIVERVFGNRNIRSQNRTKVLRWPFWSIKNWFKTKAVIYNDHKIKKTRIITKRRMRIRPKTRKWKISPASVAGLCAGDVIVKCGQVSVHSHLEFVEALWDKEGKSVELELMRPSTGRQTVTLSVGTLPKMPRWDV